MTARTGLLAVAAAIAALLLPAAADARRPVVAYIDEAAGSATREKLRLYDAELGAEVPAPDVTVPLVGGRRRFALSPSGRFVAWVDASKKIHLLDRSTASQVGLARDPAPNSVDVYDAGGPPDSLTVSDGGRIAFDDNGAGPALVYESSTNAFVDSGLGGGNSHANTALTGDGRLLATTCMTSCVADQGSDNSVFLQDLAAKANLGFPENLSGATDRDEDRPCVDRDGSRVGLDIPSPVKRDVYVYDRGTGATVALPAGANSATDDEFFCALDGDGRHLGYFRQTATDFKFMLADLAGGTFVPVPAGKVQSEPVWLTAPYTRFTKCGALQCGTVRVPLDRSGAFPGTVDLAVRRKPATSGTSNGVLVALTGGPGFAAIPDLGNFARELAPAHVRRDLAVFDQRGTGLSGFLTCGVAVAGGPNAGVCANNLGARRAFYRSRDSADDLEEVRVALGVDKIALFAVSYGGVVAYDYVSRYPDRVQLLMLDSPMRPPGWDWRQLAAATAYRRVLAATCRLARCKGITRNVLADTAKVSARLRKSPRVAPFFLKDGRKTRVRFTGANVVNALQEADLNSAIRPLFPAALRSAASGDLAPLVRLVVLARGDASGIEKRAADGSTEFSTALNSATNCEETAFPWKRSSPPSVRDRTAALFAELKKIPQSAYSPFYGKAVALAGIAAQCMRWPHTARPALLDTTPAPDVRTLLFAGDLDTRTPVEQTRSIARRFPRSSMVVGHEVDHGVLSDRSAGPCLRAAMKRFVDGAAAGTRCSAKFFIPPAPLAPRSLKTVTPEPGLAGERGRTLRAVRLTGLDVEYVYLMLIQANDRLQNAAGGLRGGHLAGTATKVRLHKLALVPGVKVDGTMDLVRDTAALTVSGSGAHGTVKLTRKRVTGKLDGKTFSLPARSLTGG